MIDIFKIATNSFSEFFVVSFILLVSLGLIINGCLAAWSRFLRMIMVWKCGWPPAHLDADGDSLKKKS